MSMQLQHHQHYVIEEFADEYQERRMARRDLLKRVLMVTGSIPTPPLSSSPWVVATTPTTRLHSG